MTDAVPARVVAVVQARLGSTRLPRKVLSPVIGQPLLLHLIERLGRAQTIDEVVLAIPISTADDELAQVAEEWNIAVHRGSESDVLDRMFGAASAHNADVVVRITADCPLVEPAVVDALVHRLLASGLDFVGTGTTYPDGLDVEVFGIEPMRQAWEHADAPSDREHVTPYIRNCTQFAREIVELDTDQSSVRLTVDEAVDLVVVQSVFEAFGLNSFSLEDVLQLRNEQPQLFTPNQELVRNEGASMTSGEKLWRRATKVIPGGSMLLSKKAEMHLPAGWPSYFSRASGCSVWDLDGREFTDVGLMGVGTNILGYGHPAVDEAVRQVIATGNLSTLNGPEEVELAEALVELHPWADMARFTRSGGEACAVAVRIGRAAAGRNGVALCGYHGWHDWYLAANLGEHSALDGHLLPGLAPSGVHRGLASSAKPFAFNDIDALKSIVSEGDIGVIFMEVERSAPPAPNFLSSVRTLASENDIVLVFDECTSGFRKTFGGIHLAHGVEPDIAVFSKTLGNGYAVSAVIGREAVMQAAQSTFISSTFWTERIGSAAALATLKAMKAEDAPRRIDEIGLQVRKRWYEAADAAGLGLTTAGLPALGSFAIEGLDPLAVKTFITQEMLSAGFLAGTALYSSIAHTDEVLDRYLESLSTVFATLSQVSNDDLVELLPHGLAQSGFQRLA